MQSLLWRQVVVVMVHTHREEPVAEDTRNGPVPYCMTHKATHITSSSSSLPFSHSLVRSVLDGSKYSFRSRFFFQRKNKIKFQDNFVHLLSAEAEAKLFLLGPKRKIKLYFCFVNKDATQLEAEEEQETPLSSSFFSSFRKMFKLNTPDPSPFV